MQETIEVIETNSFPAVARELPNGRILGIIGRSGTSAAAYLGWKTFEPEIPVGRGLKFEGLIESARRLGIKRLQFRIKTETGENVERTFNVDEL